MFAALPQASESESETAHVALRRENFLALFVEVRKSPRFPAEKKILLITLSRRNLIAVYPAVKESIPKLKLQFDGTKTVQIAFASHLFSKRYYKR